MTANLLREDESFPTAEPPEPRGAQIIPLGELLMKHTLEFHGGPVDTNAMPASHPGSVTPTTRLTSQQLVTMARSALDRITSGDSSDPKGDGQFALDCLIDAVERWP